MKELLTYIINNIVNNPKEVKITLEKTGEEKMFIVNLPKEEIGTVIGSGGKTIRAIKTLLSLKGKGENFSLEIKEA
jgi:hypothetical protein